MKVRCLHCRRVLPLEEPGEPVAEVHVGSGAPVFEHPLVLGAVARHAPEHARHAWIGGRDYEVTETCRGCGSEFAYPHLCREHMLCGLCHPVVDP